MPYLKMLYLSFCVDAVASTRRHSGGFRRPVQGEPRAQPVQRYLQQLPQVRPRPLPASLSWTFLLKELSAHLACCRSAVRLTQGRPRVPERGSVCRLPEQHVLWPVPAVEGAREVQLLSDNVHVTFQQFNQYILNTFSLSFTYLHAGMQMINVMTSWLSSSNND